MRCFIAVECPIEVRERLSQVQKAVRACGDMKAVEPNNLHITLKFLGEVEEGKIQAVVEALSRVEHPSFTCQIRGIGAFPSPGGAKVIWAGMADGFEETVKLHSLLEAVLNPLGFEPDLKFHPHVTLARVNGYLDRKKIWDLLESKSQTVYGTYLVQEFALMESRLSRSGPTYNRLGGFPLK
jgi:RNA 2',3'-cyclic 3'-phosphodiesterase